MLLATLIQRLHGGSLTTIWKRLGRPSRLPESHEVIYLRLEVSELEERRVLNAAAPVASAPVASSATFSTNENTALAVPVSIGLLTHVTDSNPAALTAHIVTPPTHGTLTAQLSGAFNYTPDLGFHGSDSFVYKANNGSADSNTATATINVEPFITGTVAHQPVKDNSSLQPFTGVTISDAGNPSQVLTVQVALDDASKGVLLGAGFVETTPTSGIYSFSGNAADATSAIRNLVFQPTEHHVAPGNTETTTLTISVDDGHVAAPVTDNNTSVDTTAVGSGPVLPFIDTQTSHEGDLFTLPNLTFTDPDFSQTHTASINWGDGAQTFPTVSDVATPSGVNGTFTDAYTHVFSSAGTFTVTVSVTNSDGQTAMRSFLVNVGNRVPVIDTTYTPGQLYEGAPLTTGTINFHDPEFTNSNPGHEFTPAFTYSVDWGDGNTASGTANVIQSTTSPTTGNFAPGNHAYAHMGTYTVKITVSDNEGGTSAALTFQQKVDNFAPTIVSTYTPATLDAGTPLALGTVNFNDPAFTDNNAGFLYSPTFSYNVNWGDGNSSTGAATVTQSTTSPTTGNFNPGPHTYANAGTFTVTITVSDDEGGTSSPLTFSQEVVAVGPQVPKIADQMTHEGDLFTLPNRTFTDPDPSQTHTASIDWGDGTQTFPAVSDVATPTGVNGTLLDNYTHVFGSVGTYKVIVSVTNSDGVTGSNFFFVTVSNRVPVIDTNYTPSQLNVGAPLTIGTIAFHDPEFSDTNPGHLFTPAFTYNVDWGDGNTASGNANVIQSTTSPTTGNFDPGSHTYTQPGNYTVKITVSDNESPTGTSDPLTFIQQVIAVGPPTIDTTYTPGQLNEGAPLTIGTIAFHDPAISDNSPGHMFTPTFTYNVDWGDGNTASGNANVIQSTTSPTTGNFDPGSHAYAHKGTYTVTITVSDNGGSTSAPLTFDQVVDNVPPAIDTIYTPGQLNEGAPLTVGTIAFHDPAFTDSTAGHLFTPTFTYSVDWGDGNTAAGTANVIQSTTSPTTGNFDPGSHAYAHMGTYTVKITVSDNEGGTSAPLTFDQVVDNVPPAIDTTHTPGQLNEGAPLTVGTIAFHDPAFTDSIAGHLFTPTFTYSVDWGDGNTASGAANVIQSTNSPTTGNFDPGSHAYAHMGTYTVKITVSDNEGGTSAPLTFDQVVDNVPPAIDTTHTPGQLNEGAPLTVGTIAFHDPAFTDSIAGHLFTPTFTYSVDWGDGNTAAGNANVLQSLVSPTTGNFDPGSHAYAHMGTYTVKITVSDNEGGTSNVLTFDQVVDNVAPAITTTYTPGQLNEGAPLTVGTIAFHDPAFTDSIAGHLFTPTFTYSVDWGDGNTTSGAANVIQSTTSPTTGNFDPGSHAYAHMGTYTVKITVSDNEGGTSNVLTFDQVVDNVPPAIDTTYTPSPINEASPLAIGSINFHDPAFADAKVGFVYNPTFTYTVNWGDGSSVTTVANVTQSATGPTTGNFDPGTHAYAHAGNYTVKISVADDEGGTSNVLSFNQQVDNVAPTLTTTYTPSPINEGSPLAIGNVDFHDPAFANTNVGFLYSPTFAYTVNWGDGSTSTLAANVLTSAASPTTGNFAPTHAYAHAGTYGVTITVADNEGGTSNVLSFNQQVDNVAPTIATGYTPGQLNEGSLLTIGNIDFHDPAFADSNPGFLYTPTFTYTVNWGDGSSSTLPASVVQSAASPTTGNLNPGTHSYGHAGTYTVSITVADNEGGTSNVLSFDQSVNNVAPTIVSNYTPGQLNEGASLAIGTIAFQDPSFAVSQASATPSGAAGNLATASGAYTPSFTFTVNWGDGNSTTSAANVLQSAVSPTTGNFDPGTHIYSHAGKYAVAITVTDNEGGTSNLFSITQNVANVVPAVANTGAQNSVNEGSTLSLGNFSFQDPAFANPNIGFLFTPSFTYSVNWGDGSAVQTGTAPISSLGADGVNTQGALTLAPHNYGVVGHYIATVTIADNEGGSSSQHFLVTVNDVPPVINGLVFSNITMTGFAAGAGTAFDPGSNPLVVTISWSDHTITTYLVGGSNVQSLTLEHQYSSAFFADIVAPIPVTVTVSELIGSSVTQTVTVPTLINVLASTGIGLVQSSGGTQPTFVASYTDNTRYKIADSTQIIRDDAPVAARAEAATEIDDLIVLRTVSAAGKEGPDVRLPAEVLDNLPGYLRRLPDGHYRVYYIQGDTLRERQIIDVNVRQGRPLDPGEDFEQTQDRPPSAQLDAPRWQNHQPPLMPGPSVLAGEIAGGEISHQLLFETTPADPPTAEPLASIAGPANIGEREAPSSQPAAPADRDWLAEGGLLAGPLVAASMARSAAFGRLGKRRTSAAVTRAIAELPPGALNPSARLLRRLRRAETCTQIKPGT